MKIRAVKGHVLLQRAGKDTVVPVPGVMQDLANVILETVIDEARKDFAKSRGVLGQHKPVGIPNTEDFFKSFRAIVKGSSIEIVSDWPTTEALTEGRAPFPMWWLTGSNGVEKASFGVGIVRVTPFASGNAWIHPGFRKYTFLERGVRKGREKAIAKLISDPRFARGLFTGDITI